MTLYSEKVMDHFRNPRKVDVIENGDDVGEVGNAQCGDIMKIYLEIEDGMVVKFETFGCGSAIASSHKLHCSVLAEEAIKKALRNYYDRNGIPYEDSDFLEQETCSFCYGTQG